MIENSYVNDFVIKSVKAKDDENGDCIVEVEASNENFDLDNEQVLQNALIKSKDFFLSNGVISDNHQHLRVDKKGNAITDNSKIIGEPIDVYTKGKSTFVKCRLYKNVEAAKDYINLLRNNDCTRIKASVGGIMPRVKENQDGSKTITAFKWNDLALTCSPVNYTVGSARLVKSLTAADFLKALSAGYGTNAADFEGGMALQKESVEGEIADEESVESLLEAVSDNKVKSEDEAVSFLMEKGFSEEKARACVREIISQGSEDMAKMTILDKVRKSLAGGKKSAGKGFFKKSNDGDEDEELDLDIDDDEDTDEDEEELEGDDDELESDGEDEDEEDDDVEPVKKGGEDVTALLGELMSKVDAISARLDESDNKQAKIEKSLIDIASEVVKIGDTPLVKKSMVSAVNLNKKPAEKNGMVSTSFSKDDWKIAKSILIKAAKAQALPIDKSEHLSVVCQKALTNGGVMSRADWQSLQDLYKKYNAE